MSASENLGVPTGKNQFPANKIKSPAVGNQEAYDNLGGMPKKKTTEQTHEDLNPQHVPEGVEKSKSRVM